MKQLKITKAKLERLELYLKIIDSRGLLELENESDVLKGIPTNLLEIFTDILEAEKARTYNQGYHVCLRAYKEDK